MLIQCKKVLQLYSHLGSLKVLLHALRAYAASIVFLHLLYTHKEAIPKCSVTCSSCMCCFKQIFAFASYSQWGHSTLLLHALHACAASSDFSLLLYIHNLYIHKGFTMIPIHVPFHAIFCIYFKATVRTLVKIHVKHGSHWCRKHENLNFNVMHVITTGKANPLKLFI